MSAILPESATGIPYSFFISSGDDAGDIRKRTKALIDDVFAPQFRRLDPGVWLTAEMWERTSPARPAAGETVNAEFVRMAKDSKHVIVILIDRLGVGTQEELEAVIDIDGPEVSVVRFSKYPPSRAGRLKVGRYLAGNQARIRYAEKRGCNSDEAWFELIKIVLHGAMRAATAHEGAFVEQRMEA